MKFTDIFIRRPVLASVVSLVILVVGLRSFNSLQVLAYPRTENGVVTVSTSFPGADPEAIAGFVTTPLEAAVAQANGIDYMTSTSQSSTSTITVYLRQNYDTSKAAAEINIKVNSVLNQLPAGTLQPTITVKVGQTLDAMFIAFTSGTLAANQITDYLTRVVQPRMQAVDGVQTAEILGGQTFSLRVWLDPKKLEAYGMTASDVATALVSNDYVSAVGNTKGQMIQVTLTSNTNLHSLDEFRDLVVKSVNGANVRLSDVAQVSLGADSYETSVAFNGTTAVMIGVQVAPRANLLSVIKGVRDVYPDIRAQLPRGLESQHHVRLDGLRERIDPRGRGHPDCRARHRHVGDLRVLGSPRSVLIPVIAIPLSLVGTLGIMLALGFSINLLTLLALVLAIGLVVDDAIIVVENVNRHLEDGMAPLAAALQAARELGGPILAMTVVLLAVYVPIGFQGGLTGALFTEFVFTLAGAVTVSAIIALTLSPMMCSRLLKPQRADADRLGSPPGRFIDARFEALRAAITAGSSAASITRLYRPVRGARARFHRPSVSQRQQRARAAGGSGLRVRAMDLRSGCDPAAKAPLFSRAISAGQGRPGHRHFFQIDRAATVLRRHAAAALIGAPSRAIVFARDSAAAPEFTSRGKRSRCSSFPRSPEPRAIRAIRDQVHRAGAATERSIASISRTVARAAASCSSTPT